MIYYVRYWKVSCPHCGFTHTTIMDIYHTFLEHSASNKGRVMADWLKTSVMALPFCMDYRLLLSFSI